jgi:ABC-type transport system substrate-binding protein
MLMTVLTAFAVMPATPAKAAAAIDDSRTLFIAVQKDMPDFNAWNLPSNDVWKANVLTPCFEGLSGIDYNLVPYPLLAESWDFDQANLTVTLHLRHGVLFHDLTEMTADDVIFTYRATRSGTPYDSNFVNAFDNDTDGMVSKAEIEANVVKIDTYTVRMFMAVSYGQFFRSTLGIPIMPKHIWVPDHYDATTGLLDTLWNDPRATYSTGAYKYMDGEAGTYRVLQKFDHYWGKDFVTPYMKFKIYPPNVDFIYFKIYASVDTCILALQAGAVDYNYWPITSGRVAGLQADPNIGLEYLSDNGYYLLDFNMKFEPMNNLSFRKAVSYLMDKDQIVNVYVGGFGRKGTAVEPPFWGEWFNDTVLSYPFDPTFKAPKDLLDAAGYIDINGDGWREMPDGRPMQKITILTPPADYDPVRIRAGQMISKNMRAIGINADSKGIDFSTLSARMSSYDYQMLTMGWSLTSDPVGNVFDSFGSKAINNYYGWWSTGSPNQYYKDLMGVNTLADARSQALSVQFDELGKKALQTFNTSEQLLYTRWGEGIVADAVPANVIYYRVNVEAHTNRWSGWIPFLGSLWYSGGNIFCLSSLERTGAAGPTTTGSINSATSLPGLVAVGKAASGFVKAVDKLGYPAAGASVALTVDGLAGLATVTVSPATGTTDAKGVLEFTVTGTGEGYSNVNVTVSKSGAESKNSVTIKAVNEFPPTLYLTVKPVKSVLRAGETTTVNLKVVDDKGAAVEGVNLTIDPNLIGYGFVENNYSMTNALGVASTIYHAPATIQQLNAHETLSLFYAAAKTGYASVSAPAANMIIYNPAAPNWKSAKVWSVGTTALTAAANQTTVQIQAINDTGVVLTSHRLEVTYSDPSIVVGATTSAKKSIVTDGTGNATLTVMVKNGAPTKALKITFQNLSLNAIPASVTLTYVGATPPAVEMYGGYMQFAEPSLYMGPLGSLEVTASMWDSSGTPADGINASLVLSGTTYGSLTGSDSINWDTTWDYLGLSIVTTADNSSVATSGPINTFFDYASWTLWYYGPDGTLGPEGAGTGDEWIYWNWTDDTLPGNPQVMTGVDVTGGTMKFWVNGSDVAPLDLIGNIYIVPQGLGFFNDTSANYEINGETSLTSSYVIGKSNQIVVPSYDIAKPVLVAETSDYQSTNVSVTVTDENNAVVSGASVKVYQTQSKGNLDYQVYPWVSGKNWSSASTTTNSNGKTNATIVAIGKNNVVTPSNVRADVYVKASMLGMVSMFQQTQMFIYVRHLMVTINPIEDIQAIGSKELAVTAKVTSWAGTAISSATVELTADVGRVLDEQSNPSVATANDTGIAVFMVDTPLLNNTRVGYMTVQAKASMASAYELALAPMTVTLQNAGPQITAALSSPGASGAKFESGSNVTLAGSVWDVDGLSSVSVKLDSGTAQIIPGPVVGAYGSQMRTVSQVMNDLARGEHTVRVNATDALGVSNELTLTFSVVKKSGADMVAWGAAIAGWVVAAALAVLMLLKMPKGQKPEVGAMEEPSKPEEAPKT